MEPEGFVMPWKQVSIMEQRQEFLSLARIEGANISELCRRYGISRDTAYRWLKREDFADRSRRPQNSPSRTTSEMEASVLAVRDAYPAWGARKIRQILLTQELTPPAVSTVQAILERHGRIADTERHPQKYKSFEKEAPNLLWQMDFKGQFQMGDGHWCWPLTIVDDHSRYAVSIEACPRQATGTIKPLLENTFRRYGLPAAFYVDNGSPWGGGEPGQYTPLRVWLLKLGVRVIHAKPYHPQGRGKNERFHRTLKREVLDASIPIDIRQAQAAFDTWRQIYNHVRPHQSLDMMTPISRYQNSARPMPDTLPEIVYDSCDIVRKVPKEQPKISFKNRTWRVPKAFQGEYLALRPSGKDGIYNVCFGAIRIATIDLNKGQSSE
jgi:transposase InsO family protein